MTPVDGASWRSVQGQGPAGHGDIGDLRDISGDSEVCLRAESEAEREKQSFTLVPSHLSLPPGLPVLFEIQCPGMSGLPFQNDLWPICTLLWKASPNLSVPLVDCKLLRLTGSERSFKSLCFS